ncbi:unnamed protein product [Microthlaspi erraticum]|uniref:Uncharacterized protein n=1 Tax=Microthlaspi erraticum TaxID=1685480 RepID=A0A6D2HY48_9BRAS|nr:unnamed protein product [Microthlaspi erraticum]
MKNSFLTKLRHLLRHFKHRSLRGAWQCEINEKIKFSLLSLFADLHRRFKLQNPLPLFPQLLWPKLRTTGPTPISSVSPTQPPKSSSIVAHSPTVSPSHAPTMSPATPSQSPKSSSPASSPSPSSKSPSPASVFFLQSPSSSSPANSPTSSPSPDQTLDVRVLESSLMGLLASLALWEMFKYCSDIWRFDRHPCVRKLLIVFGQWGEFLDHFVPVFGLISQLDNNEQEKCGQGLKSQCEFDEGSDRCCVSYDEIVVNYDDVIELDEEGRDGS